MTTIDELHYLLDERGADYRVSATGYSIDIGPYTTVYANRSDTTLDVSLRQVTPARAIAATLGTWTCKLPETRIDHGQIEYNGVTEWRKCSACGAEILAYPAHFCPNCGAKVVEE